jgi:Spy/CpxP family protein refolding chaperone
MFNIDKKVFGAVLATMLIAVPVLAANSSTGDGADGGRAIAQNRVEGAGEHGKRFGFTDSQLEKMASIKNLYMDKTSSERAELGTLHRQLRDVLSQTSVDRSKAEGIQSKINQLHGDLSTAKLDLKMDEMSVLSPEQREQMHHRMLVAEAFGGGHMMHHRHGGGGKHFQHGGHGGGKPGAEHQEKA